MFELIAAGGLLMVPILLCSVIALAIVGERFWSLRPARVIPPALVAQVLHLQRHGQLDPQKIQAVRASSPLGEILVAGLLQQRHSREVMKERIEESGRQVTLQLERYLNTLGTIATITPLLGLLGTVVGMIRVFAAISAQGVGNPTALAGGISEALITTAAGLLVAIPSLMFYRYFRGRVDELVLRMEVEAQQLVMRLYGDRSTTERH